MAMKRMQMTKTHPLAIQRNDPRIKQRMPIKIDGELVGEKCFGNHAVFLGYTVFKDFEITPTF